MEGFGDASPFTEHGDVMSADPQDAQGKAALVGELKLRGKGAFTAKNYPAAEKLYSKAIAVLPDAALHSNRAAARSGLGRHEGAIDDADASIRLDPKFAKAYYRKGQACLAAGRTADAIQAYQAGGKLEPDNKAWSVALAKAKAASNGSDTISAPSTKSDAGENVTTKSSPVTSATKKSAVSSRTAAESSTITESEASRMRGYKITADGRKTTFFNNDLSDEAKALIGDIAPKKIDANSDGTSPVNDSSTAHGGSQWNTAGTWEERDCTVWCKERLAALLTDLNVKTPQGSIDVTVNDKDITGDASITFSRGKQRFLYEFNITLRWECELDCGPAKGTLVLPDMSYDCEGQGDYCTQVTVDNQVSPHARQWVDQYVRSPREGLKPAVQAQLQAFLHEFKAKR